MNNSVCEMDWNIFVVPFVISMQYAFGKLFKKENPIRDNPIQTVSHGKKKHSEQIKNGIHVLFVSLCCIYSLQ